MNVSLAEQLSPHLPYLRRFARALCGTQDVGDKYVVAMLEALVADQGMFDRSIAPRTAAYKLFLSVWNTVPHNRDLETPGSSTADRRIESLTPEPRQAFLLAGVEDFPASEIALIMGTSEDGVRSLIDSAGHEIAQQLAARVLIIEDEPLIAMDIESLVTDLGHEVVGIAATRGEAFHLAKNQKPEIVLADIQLADGSSGIDAVNDILTDCNVPVVFVTAYPERLLTGERPEPAFLVSKPFKPEMLKAVMSQALFFEVKAGKADKDAAA